MKSEKASLSGLIALSLSFLIAFGTVQVMVTAFDLDLAARWLPAGACLAWGLAAVLLGRFRGGGWGLMVLFLAMTIHLWRRSQLSYQLWQLVYRITHHYDAAYDWGVFKLVDTAWNAGTAELPLALLGGLIAWSAALTILRGEGAVGPLMLSILPLMACLVVTDTVPSGSSLFMLMLGQLLLLLGSHVRSRDRYQADRLVLLALLPAVLFLGGIFLLLPKESHADQSQAIQARILDWIRDLPDRKLPGAPSVTITVPHREPAVLDLGALGPRDNSAEQVMWVISDAGGTLYLRGQDHDQYDGRSWTASPYRVETLGYEGPDLGILSIETEAALGELYLPYYPEGGLSLIGGRVENTRLSHSYVFRRQGLPDVWQSASAGQQVFPEVDPVYLDLPQAAREGAEVFLAQILQEDTMAGQAAAIAAFLRSHSAYDLQAQRMPEEEEDFALWFLEKEPPGYCIHYATSAVVLLRAAGIPARYVSGYMTQVEAGVPHAITQTQAHAWAEYYEPNLDAWLVVEATPNAAEPTVEPPPEVSATIPTTSAPIETVSVPEETGSVPSESATVPTSQPQTAQTELPSPGLKPAPLLWILTAMAIVPLQARLRLTVACRRLRRTDPNRRCLLLWKETEKRARLLKTDPPRELMDLAQKAKFSQHTITSQELDRFDSYLTQANTQLRTRSWPWQLIYRFLYALF